MFLLVILRWKNHKALASSKTVHGCERMIDHHMISHIKICPQPRSACVSSCQSGNIWWHGDGHRTGWTQRWVHGPSDYHVHFSEYRTTYSRADPCSRSICPSPYAPCEWESVFLCIVLPTVVYFQDLTMFAAMGKHSNAPKDLLCTCC